MIPNPVLQTVDRHGRPDVAAYPVRTLIGDDSMRWRRQPAFREQSFLSRRTPDGPDQLSNALIEAVT